MTHDLSRELEECAAREERYGAVGHAALLRRAAEAVKAAEMDAARYRWLRVQKYSDVGACWFRLPSEIDAAIDAAMHAGTQMSDVSAYERDRTRIASRPCECVSCHDCRGTGYIWFFLGEYYRDHPCDDMAEPTSCDSCEGSGVTEPCDRCMELDELERAYEEERNV